MAPFANLDLFVLVLISRGLGTPYEMKRRAGTSLGTTLPVLDRLMSAGLIRAGDPGPRGSRRFTVTKSGAEKLKAGWKTVLNHPTSSPDEIFRMAYLALSLGGEDIARAFLARAARDLSARADIRSAEADVMRHKLQGSADPEWYSFVKLQSEAVAMAAQARCLSELATETRGRKRRKERP